jgi:hypothetical protein
MRLIRFVRGWKPLPQVYAEFLGAASSREKFIMSNRPCSLSAKSPDATSKKISSICQFLICCYPGSFTCQVLCGKKLKSGVMEQNQLRIADSKLSCACS